MIKSTDAGLQHIVHTVGLSYLFTPYELEIRIRSLCIRVYSLQKKTKLNL